MARRLRTHAPSPPTFEHLAVFSKHIQAFLPATSAQATLEFIQQGLGASTSSPTPCRPSTFRIACKAGLSPSPSETSALLSALINDLPRIPPSAPPYALHQSSWFPRAFALLGGNGPLSPHAIQQLPAVSSGSVSFQTFSSMLPALCLDARPGMTVLDLCAAPGGKTTLIAGDASLMAGQGRLLAVDSSFPRVERLKHNVRLLLLPKLLDPPDAAAAAEGRGADSAARQQQQRRQSVLASLPASFGSSFANVTVCKADARFLKASLGWCAET
jgi:hypothetical protein